MQLVLGIMQVSHKVGASPVFTYCCSSAEFVDSATELDPNTGLSLPANYLPPGQLFATGNVSLCGHFCIHLK